MADENTQTETQENAGAEQARTFTQEEVNHLIGERLDRFKASIDLDGLQAKAAQYDQAQDAAKSDLQKAVERAEAAEKARDEAVTAAAREAVARAKGVPPEHLTGTTREEMEASADALLSWRSEAAQSNSFNRRGGFFSGASGGAETADDPKARAAAAVRRIGRH